MAAVALTREASSKLTWMTAFTNKLRAGIYNYMIRPRNISGTLRYKTRRFFGCLSPWKSTNLTFLSNLWAAMSKSNPPKNSYIFFLIDLAWDQTWSFIRIILTRPECNVIFPPGFPRHTVSSIFYIDNVGGSSRQFEKILLLPGMIRFILWLIIRMIPSCGVRWIASLIINWTLNWMAIEIWSESNFCNAIQIPDPSAWISFSSLAPS